MKIGNFAILTMSAYLAACNGLDSGSISRGGVEASATSPLPNSALESPANPIAPPLSSPAAIGPAAFKVCSPLDFTGVVWSASLSGEQQSQLELALNISGSYEGETGWANLTNDFDGQGLSMGLLNQNFGQGSLQPMWNEMYTSYNSEMKAAFAGADFSSVTALILSQQTPTLKSASLVTLPVMNKLDDPVKVAAEAQVSPGEFQILTAAISSNNQVAVNWAVNTLYSGSSFKPEWSQALTLLAQTQGYRSIQIEKALNIHNSAMSYLKTYGLSELRSYLFMFDVVVQNGSLSSTVLSNYRAWLAANPSATETQKLEQILSLRLNTVLAAYVADVSSRKTALINGKGLVHGKNYNFDQEYCVNLDMAL